MNQSEFIERIKKEVNFGGRINTGITDDRFVSIIDNNIDYFHENDDRVNMEHFLIVKNSYFNNELFRNKRIIKLPSCVKSVVGAWRSEKQHLNSFAGTIDADFRKLNGLYGNAVGTGQTLLQAITTASYYDFVGSLTLDTVSFDFSEFNNSLYIRGGNLTSDLILEVGAFISDESIYNMKDFFDYTVGKCLEEFISVVSFTEQKLLGDFSINLTEISKKSTKLIEKVEKKHEAQLGENDFIVEW